MCVDRNPRLKMRTWGCGALSPHARAHVCTSQPNSDKQFDLSLRFGCKLLRLTSVQAALMLKLPSWFFFSLFGPTRCAINKMQGPKWRRALGYRLRLLLQGQTHLDTLEGRQPSPWRPCSYVPFNEVKKCAVHSWWNAARSWGGSVGPPSDRASCWRKSISLGDSLTRPAMSYILASPEGHVLPFQYCFSAQMNKQKKKKATTIE